MLDQALVPNTVIFHESPGFFWLVNRARSALFESPGVIRMGVGNDYGFGFQPVDSSQPVGSAIDHDSLIIVRHQRQLCMWWRCVFASSSPRVPRKVSFTKLHPHRELDEALDDLFAFFGAHHDVQAPDRLLPPPAAPRHRGFVNAPDLL